MTYNTHPLLKPGALEHREYQSSLAMEALEGNSLVVLATGLGKTPVLLLLALAKYAEGKILVMAPTRALVEQHARFFRSMLAVPDEEVGFVHGLVPDADRAQIYARAKVIAATPQTIRADMEEGFAQKLALVCFDEAHRAVGGYAYCDVAAQLRAAGSPALILGLTATPGSDEQTVHAIRRNLGIVKVLARARTDPDVAPYVKPIAEEVIPVPLDPQMKDALKILHKMAQVLYDEVNEKARPSLWRDRVGGGTAKSDIIRRSKRISAQITASKNVRTAGGPPLPRGAYVVVRDLAAIVMLRHAIEMAESQGAFVLWDYLNSIEKKPTKAATMIRATDGYKKLMRLLPATGFGTGVEGAPVSSKVSKIRELVEESLMTSPDSKILIFSNYRATVETIYDALRRPGPAPIRPARFVGQADGRVNRGMKQSAQRKAVDMLRSGEANVLISTSVGEEGIDIPGVDLCIFHEPVPSAVRHVQRKGRTGRFDAGRCIILKSEGVDEASLAASRRSQKGMEEVLTSPTRQTALVEATDGSE